MNGRSLMRAAVVIAVVAAIGLAIDVAVEGVERAAGLAGVLSGFCELAAVVLGVAGWTADRRDADPNRAKIPANTLRAHDGESANNADGDTSMVSRPVYIIDSQGVAIGKIKKVVNNFGSHEQSDKRSQSGLSPN